MSVKPPDDVPFPERGEGDPSTRLDAVIAEVGALRVLLERHDRSIEGFADVADLVKGLADDVARLRGGEELDEAQEAEGRPWRWVTMPPVQQADRLSLLARWVRDVLRPRYGYDSRVPMRACWPHHPAVIEELSMLYGMWAAAYVAKEGTWRDAAEWHDRWLPGVLNRMTDAREFDQCPTRHHEVLAPAETGGWDAPAARMIQQLREQQT